MIKIIYGGLTSGKTDELLESMKPYKNNLYITNQTQVIYIEKMMAQKGLQGTVVSPENLGSTLFSDMGVYNIKILQPSEELLILKRAIDSLNLRIFGKVRYKSQTLKKILGFMHELQNENVGQKSLVAHTQKLNDEKIKELSLIYEAFENECIKQRVRTKQDAAYIGSCRAFLDTSSYDHIVVDVIDNYTRAIKELVFKCALNNWPMHMALLGVRGNASVSDLDEYEQAKRIEQAISKIKGKVEVKSANGGLSQASGIKVIKECFFDKGYYKQGTSLEGVDLYEATSVLDEVTRTADKIQELIENGEKPEDIVISVSDTNIYNSELAVALSNRGINYKADKTQSLLDFDIYTLVKICCEAAEKGEFTGDNILKLSYLPYFEVSTLEQAFLKRLFLRFGDDINSAIKDSGKYNEEAEQKVVIPLILRLFNLMNPVIEAINNGTIGDVVAKLIELCDKAKISNYYTQLAQKQKIEGRYHDYEMVMSMWEGFTTALQHIFNYAGKLKSTSKLCYDVFTAVFSEQGIVSSSYSDEVYICTPHIAKDLQMKHLFMLGCNDGYLPKRERDDFVSDTSLWEIKELADIADSQKRTQRNIGDIYLTLCRPNVSLHISWALSVKGKTSRMALVLHNIADIFESKIIRNLSNEDEKYTTLLEALVKYKRFGIKTPALDDFDYFKSNELYKYRLKQDIKCISRDFKQFNADTDALNDCYKSKDSLAITELEAYSYCPFSHFVRYGLRPKELKRHIETAADAGNYYHEVLAEYFKQSKLKDMKNITETECYQKVEKICEAVESEHNDSYLDSTAGTRYLKDMMRKQAKKAVWAAVQQLAKGEFKVSRVESLVGLGADRELTCANGKIHLIGKIDRYDVLNDKYIRIIDYKSGSTRYNEEAFKAGIQLQLPLYLQALNEYKPAGMYYMPISSSVYMDKDKKSSEFKEYQFSGPTLEDRNILVASDETLADDGSKSDIISAEVTKSGDISARSNVLSEEDFEGLRKQALAIAEDIVFRIYSGTTKAYPYKNGTKASCTYCNYKTLCRFDPTGDDKYRTEPY